MLFITMPGPAYPDDSKGPGVTATVFIIASLVVSFLPLLWCLRALHVNHKSGGRKPNFVIALLTNMLLQFVFSPAAIRFYLKSECSDNCERAYRMFLMTQISGIFLHQLVALESVLSLRNPLYTTDLFSMPCSITLSVMLYVFAFVCVLYNTLGQFGFCLPSVLILILTIIFTVKAPPSPPSDPDTHKKTQKWVLAVSTVTMVVAYLPFLMTLFIRICSLHLSFMPRMEGALTVTPAMMSLRAISDVFLCVLVFKKVLPVQTAQTQA